MSHPTTSLPQADFPILTTVISGKPLIYLDNAATSQKPRAVINAITNFYEHDNANVHRGVHTLSVRATQAYEQARMTVQKFLNAAHPQEIIFTRNATEALNLLATTLGSTLQKGDEIILSALEHHSNLVPWQVVAQKTGAILKIWQTPGEARLGDLQKLITPKTKIVAVTHVSNVLGAILPIKKIAQLAHAQNGRLIVDGAQAVGHMPVDVREIDADAFVFSGHKTLGPTGIGVLYGKQALLQKLGTYQTGGEMVATVSYDKATFADLPARLEAGTPNVAGAVGLAAALEFIRAHDVKKIAVHEQKLAKLASNELAKLSEVTVLSQPTSGIVTFVVRDVHPHDVGTILDQEGIAIRTGLLCAEPLIRALGYDAVCRASFAGYNAEQDVWALVRGVKRAIAKLGGTHSTAKP